MRRLLPLLCLVAMHPGNLIAQAVLRGPDIDLQRIQVQSCPAADSLLGAPTKAQLHAIVRASRPQPDGTTLVLSGPANWTGRNTTLWADLPPRAGGPGPEAQLSVLVPAKFARPAIRDSSHLMVLLDRSLSLDFRVPDPPAGELPASVSFVPMTTAPIGPASLLAIARAHEAEVRFGKARIRLKRAELTEVNAYVRVLYCARIEPLPR
jgi:hypothetical protein